MPAADQGNMKGNTFGSLTREPRSGEKKPGLYLHIPFCRSKCSYCSFISYPCAGVPPEDYLKALLLQIERMAEDEWVRPRTFETLFIGGGTPTIYRAEQLDRLIGTTLAAYRFVPSPEITVESNPNTVNLSILQTLRAAGVNRLSIGVQSFSDDLLRAIGRTHSAGQAREAFRTARRAGFDNINLDLMFGLPGQTVRDFEASLQQALALGPEHLALYELMLEEGSLLTQKVQQGQVTLPSEDESADMSSLAEGLLPAAGYERYEVSNFAGPGRECRHNINYWENGDYLGLGAGAVSCLSGLRIRNLEEVEGFVRRMNQGEWPYLEGECLSLESRFRETVILGLRMTRGVSLSGLEERFALTPEGYYGKTIQNLQAAGLLEITDQVMRLTSRGFPLANQVLAQLV
jgi:oxygen-independent coproporphyrinogen-3 oxidase